MPLFSTIDIEQRHYFYRLERSFIMTGKYNQKKGRRNIHRGRRRRRIGMIQTVGVVAVVLLSFMIIIGFVRKNSAELGSESSLNDRQIKYINHDKQDGMMNAQGGDTPWNLILVNNKNHIPKDYKPKLTEVQGGEYVDERIYAPLMEMLEAAREGNGGKLPLVVSGYRTPEKQQELYDEKIMEYKKEGYPDNEAKELAEQWVAVPGYSEHQLGFAVDINGETYDVYLWLQENSYKYGFIFRYPGDKTQFTGVAEEVWHYRYVGVEAATEMYEQGLCLEEYHF